MNATLRPCAQPIQATRSELKFEIDEPRARRIRPYLAAHLHLDPNCRRGPYQVCSVYLDSPDAVLYRQTKQGLRNRFKLRVRIYDNDPANPAYLEIKRRDGRAVRKQRVAVDRELATAILAGETVSLSQNSWGATTRPTQQDWQAFYDFCKLRDQLGAVGSTYTYYRREAHVSLHDSSWRATFDRQLIGRPYRLGAPLSIPSGVDAEAAPPIVVFELKFTNRFPNWMRDVVRTFNLQSGPFPKYVLCREGVDGLEQPPSAIAAPVDHESLRYSTAAGRRESGSPT